MKVNADNFFDVAKALYWYCSDNHEGQASEKYRILSNIGYTPAPSERGVSDDDESGQIHTMLVLGNIDLTETFNNLQEFQHAKDF